MSKQGANFWEPCWACRVLSGEAAGSVVAETQEVVALINPFPLSSGHTLVVPRRHIKDLYELPDELAGPILSMAARVARAAKQGVRAEGVTLRQNNEAASDQHLFHFHLHIIPRFEGDIERFNAAPQQASRAEQEAMASRLRAAIAAQESIPSSP